MRVTFERAVLPRDLDALVAFDRSVFSKADAFDAGYWEQLESFWMMVDAERAGCCAFERDADFQDNCAIARRKGSLYIVSTAISRERQRQGLGERFKRWQIAWARRHGFARIVTNSRQSNRAMIRLNEKFGFRITRVTGQNYYSRPQEPAVVMELYMSRRIPVVESALKMLIAERDRVDRAIRALTS
jgi:GNAT superfamily N-acetyltransferase